MMWKFKSLKNNARPRLKVKEFAFFFFKVKEKNKLVCLQHKSGLLLMINSVLIIITALCM